MERLGLEGDVAIESRLVSKTIENAQSRVEGYNFDIRKRVVEYDDVINKQRETTYAERDKVLRNEDLSETVMDFVSGELEVLVEQHLGPVLDDWDLDGLSRSVRQLGIDGEGVDAEDLAELPGQDEIADRLTEVAEATLKAREERYGPEVWAMVERQVLLRSIDSLWVDHLTELDDFRRGVGLRGYGGTDPLVEFKREAFKLYEELRGFIRHQVASTIYRVSVQVQAPTPPPARTLPMPTPEQLAALRAGSASSNGGGDGAGGNAPQPAALAATAASSAAAAQAAVLPGVRTPARPGTMRLQHGDETAEVGGTASAPASAAKIGRNDPCWCGSGQKYKRCHGA
jgi:preprotein translocase subunit SecA